MSVAFTLADLTNASVKYRPANAVDAAHVIHIKLPKDGNFTSIADEVGRECSGCFRLDASTNALTAIPTSLSYLDWLDVHHNRINSLHGVDKLPRLKMLNIAENCLRDADTHLIDQLAHLKAFVANGNELKRLPALTSPHQCLETLIVSHNQLKRLDNLERFPRLSKLSASHNKIKELPATAVGELRELSEIRLNHNRLKQVPAELAQCSRLKLIDLGENRIASYDSLQPLTELRYLRNLNLKGNPLATAIDYATKITDMFPHVQIFDNMKRERFLSTHQQQQQQQQQQEVKKKTVVEEKNEVVDDDDDDDEVDLDEFKRRRAAAKRKPHDDGEEDHNEEESKSKKKKIDDADVSVTTSGIVAVKFMKRHKKAATKVKKADLLTAAPTHDIGRGESAWD